MEKHLILGVHITDRLVRAGEIQTILTKYGNCIKTRLGLHDVSGSSSSPNGVLLLECVCQESCFDELAAALGKVEGVDVKKMVFDHE